MATGSSSPPRPSIPIRSPVFAPPVPVAPPSPDPSWIQTPPVRFLNTDERVDLSIKPSLLAFLSVPALLASAVSLGALAADLALAPNGGSSALYPGLTAVFVLAYVASVVLWAWLLGLGYLVVLPLSYFFGSYAILLSTPSTSGVVPVANGGNPDPGSLFLFVLALELLPPLVLAMLAWTRSFYVVTSRRAVEVSGYWSATSRDLSLDRITSVQTSRSVVAARLGYGTVLLRTIPPVGREPWGGAHLSVRRRNVGLAFFGVRNPIALGLAVQGLLNQAQKAGAAATPPTL